MPAKLAAAQAAQREAAEAFERTKAAAEARTSERTLALNELTKGVTFYKRLGLDFERVGEDHLRLVFTQVDPAEPDRRFFFTLHVDANDVYNSEWRAGRRPPRLLQQARASEARLSPTQ